MDSQPTITSSRDVFLRKAYDAAVAAGHPWPAYAACEAALESAWGTSKLAIQGNNLFGEKQHIHPIYETLDLPTTEIINGLAQRVSAHWVKFPDWPTCFQSRIATVKRLAADHIYSGYCDALAATTGEGWVRNVSRNWSTDPLRADKVLLIYNSHRSAFPVEPPPPATPAVPPLPQQ